MALIRRRSPIALRLGRALRRTATRRAHLARHVEVTSSLFAEAWSAAPLPAGATIGVVHPPVPFDPDDLVARPLPMGDVPPPDDGVPAGRLRRCAFRRLDVVPSMEPRRGAAASSRGATAYTIVCLYLDATDPAPIGDLTAAVGVCGACTFSGIFRPDAA